MSERYSASEKNWSSGADRAHLCRYYVARGFIQPEEKVIDLGCGVGYGTQMLSKVALKVTGVDKGEVVKSIGYEMDEFIEFVGCDLESEEVRDLPEADVLVCLEVLEHLENPKLTLERITPLINRLLILSVPLGEEVGEDGRTGNPWHKQGFASINQVRNIVPEEWTEFHSLRQGRHLILVFYKEE